MCVCVLNPQPRCVRFPTAQTRVERDADRREAVAHQGQQAEISLRLQAAGMAGSPYLKGTPIFALHISSYKIPKAQWSSGFQMLN